MNLQSNKKSKLGMGIYEYHPAVSLIFFLSVIFVTMIFPHPVFTGVSLMLAFFCSVLLNGIRPVLFTLKMLVPIIVFTVILNSVFNRAGLTVWLTIGNKVITREATVYGAVAACMFSAVLLWFSCLNSVLTAEKLSFLLGRLSPSVSLTLIMTLRFVPRFTEMLTQINAGEKALGGHKGTLRKRVKSAARVISVMMSWSLESGIITADSMRARGYGLKPKTRFSVYKLQRRDITVLIAELALIAFTAYFLLRGWIMVSFFPVFYMQEWTLSATLSTAAFFTLCSLPLCVWAYDALLRKRFKRNCCNSLKN